MFKWCCLGLAVTACLVIGWMVNDLRVKVGTTVDTINRDLPSLLAKSKTTAETLAGLSDDVKQLKNLAGVRAGDRDQNLVAFADGLLDRLEKSGGVIGRKKLLSSGLKDTELAKVWVSGARREALWKSVLLVRSREDLLNRLAKNWHGANWYIQFGTEEPLPLIEWMRKNQPADEPK